MSIERDKILSQLARVMNQVAESGETVARNRKVVAELERDGQDVSLATKMLKYLEHVQSINLTEQRRLEKMLSEKIDEPEKIDG
jgi:hypothetical protein